MARVVVIGAGVGGLAAAVRLATAGHEVVVLEQSGSVGGKLGRYSRDGFTFDTGPSIVTLPGVLRELFAETGYDLDEVLELEPVQPIARYRYADGTGFDATGDLDEMADQLDGALMPGSGHDWRRLMAHAERMWKAVERPFLRSPVQRPRDLLRQSVRFRDLATIAPHRTLRDLSRRYFRDPRLGMFLERYATYTGSDPRRAPAALATVPYVEQTYGAWYVRGGLYRIAEVLSERAMQRGATVRTGADVATIERAGDRVSGVRLTDGSPVYADIVVANADATHVYADLLVDGAASDRRALGADRSLAGFVMLLALRGRTPDLPHHTVLFPENYNAEFDAIFGPDPEPVFDPTLYISVPDDPSRAPQGHEAWFVLVNAPRHGRPGVDWEAPGATERYMDHLLDRLALRGLDVRDRIVFAEARSPADLERRTRALGGAIYGTSSNGPRAAFLRPTNRSPVPGLFLVGGSTHPGGGLPLVLLSAGIVADLVGLPRDHKSAR